MRPIAVEGLTLIPNPVPPLTIMATIVPDSPTGSKVKAENKLVYRQGDTFKISNITAPSLGATTPDPLIYTVSLVSSAIATKAENVLVMLEEDESVEINAQPIIPGPPPVPVPVIFKCKIISAGQTKVKAK